MNEADTCRKFVVPKLQAAGWDNEPHSIAEQRTITDGRIVPVGKGFVRKSPKRADYILRYERNFPLAVVEAKADWQTAGQGIQQAKEYAELLQLKFAYATNGVQIVEFDYFTGKETIVQSFPTPAELWARYTADKQILGKAGAQMLTPMNHLSGKGERYYQEIAINRAVEGILTGRRRQLLTMTEAALKALHEAIAKVVEEHRQQGRPLAVWRNGRAVWISADEVTALREEPIPYRTAPHDKTR